MSTPVKFIVNFVIVMLIQLFVLNDIVLKSTFTLAGFPVFSPIIYPIILLMLPVNTPSWLLMGLGMLVGLTMDMFSDTPGMHAASMVLICFLRLPILRLFFQQNQKELGGVVPSLYKLGFTSFIVYISIMIVVHHFTFYLLQIWSIKSILIIFLKTILSGIVSVLLILLGQLLFAKKETNRP